MQNILESDTELVLVHDSRLRLHLDALSYCGLYMNCSDQNGALLDGDYLVPATTISVRIAEYDGALSVLHSLRSGTTTFASIPR